MPGTDRVIDPYTRDYVLQDDGSYQTTRTARTAVYHAINCHRSKWADDADFGSRFYTLARGKNITRTPKIVEDFLVEALQGLIDAGRISTPVILTERTSQRITFEVTCRDLQSDEEIVLTDLLPFEV